MRGLRVSGFIDSCITQLKAQGPSRSCNESKEEEEEVSMSGFGVRVSGFGLWLRGSGLRCMVYGFGFRASGFGFIGKVQGLRFRIWSLGFRESDR